MPPWFAEPGYGPFSNDRSLSEDEIETLVRWADSGAPEGDAKDSPPLRHWIEDWNIPKPDLVLEMPPPFPLPASGDVEYQYIVVPTGFEQDKWVEMAELRPGNPRGRTPRRRLHSRAGFRLASGRETWSTLRPAGPHAARAPARTAGRRATFCSFTRRVTFAEKWPQGSAQADQSRLRSRISDALHPQWPRRERSNACGAGLHAHRA